MPNVIYEEIATADDTPSEGQSGRLLILAAGVAHQLPSLPCKPISIKARASNSGLVFVGFDDQVFFTGEELSAGQSTSFAIDNANKVFCAADTANQRICFKIVR